MLLHLVPLEGINHLPFPAFVFGLIALGALALGLLCVMTMGVTRPHS